MRYQAKDDSDNLTGSSQVMSYRATLHSKATLVQDSDSLSLTDANGVSIDVFTDQAQVGLSGTLNASEEPTIYYFVYQNPSTESSYELQYELTLQIEESSVDYEVAIWKGTLDTEVLDTSKMELEMTGEPQVAATKTDLTFRKTFTSDRNIVFQGTSNFGVDVRIPKPYYHWYSLGQIDDSYAAYYGRDSMSQELYDLDTITFKVNSMGATHVHDSLNTDDSLIDVNL